MGDRAPAVGPDEAQVPSGREPHGSLGAPGLVLAARVALGLAEIGGRGAGELAERIVPRPPRVLVATAGRISARLEPAGAFVWRRIEPWSRRGVMEQRANRELAEWALRGLIGAIANVALEEIDLDDIADRLDVTRLVHRLDLDEVVSRVDLDRVVERLDLDEVVSRVDLDRVVERLDLDAVVSRVDLDRVVERLDLDVIVERLDLTQVARHALDELDLDTLIRESTSGLAEETVEALRAQGTHADHLMGRIADRLRMRRAGPPDP